MTTLAVPALLVDTLYDATLAAGIAAPERVGDPEGDRNFVWTPDLSASDLATVNDLLTLARASQPLSLATYQSVRPDMQTLRDLRQMGRNAYMALSATERDRLMYDAMTSVTRVLIALLREEP